MAGDPRVLELLEEMLDAGKTPEEACHGHPELLDEVRERWREFRRIDAAVGELLPGIRTAPGVGPVPPGSPAAGPPQVPGYELFEEVGRGGMGVVYRARDLGLDRDVAVKLLQDGYPADSPVARRFTDESRITAQLQHPGVPAVYRVGALSDDRPFLAMKLIKGRTLAAHLGQRPDPAADRGRFVAVFEDVCQAVGYAHSLRVLHRDLKPSNVMVGKFAEVQVMDWGLAKLLTGREGERPEGSAGDGTVIRTRAMAASDTPDGAGGLTPPTRVGSVLGTPAYMAPEQAGGEIDRLDPRCDVFGLGAVLCEILTGQPPYTGRDADQVYRKAMAANQADAHARLAACGAEPELVALCRRCLAPEPDDRPRDAGEVATAVATLRAAAEDRARRAELDRVRAAEQGKRRRVLLAASGVVVAVLLAGLGVSLWQTWRAVQAEAAATEHAVQAGVERDAKDAALAAEQQARRDETKARQQAFDALRSMTTEVVERKFAQGAALTDDDRAFLRGVIAQFDAFAAIKGDDADSRAARAEGRFRVGVMRQRLGELREAEQDYDQALSIQQQLAADFPDRPEFRKQLTASHTNRGVLLRDTGRRQEAEQDFDRAVSIDKQLVADFPDRPEFRRSLAISHINRGPLLFATGRRQEAEQDFDQAVSIGKQLVADLPDRPEFRGDLARSHISRGVLLRNMNRARAAEQDYDQAVSLLKRLSADFPGRPEFRQSLGASHSNRGNLRFDAARIREAEQDYNEALSIRRQLAADFPNQPDRRNELAMTCGNLAVLHMLRGNWAAAKRQSLEGEPHDLAALKVNPQHLTYRQSYHKHLGVLTMIQAGLLEPAAAVGTAETRRDLGWDAPKDAFDAACYLSLCVPIVARHDKLDAAQRKEAAQFYGDAAMKLLREAVSKGYKDAAQMKQSAHLDPLRQRDEFRALVAELEAKGK